MLPARYKVALVFLVLVASCSRKENPEHDEAEQEITGIEATIAENPVYSKIAPLKLSEYDFFSGKLSDLKPSRNVVPYDINSPLFSDYASKRRFIYLPEGEKIGFRESEVLDFPPGTVLIKNFYYPGGQLKGGKDRIIETRLLVHKKGGWKAYPYIWNKEQTEAFLEITGGTTQVNLRRQNDPVAYSIPTMAECKSCHELNGKIMPIGPSAKQLNKEFDYGDEKANQLTHLSTTGWIDSLPKPSTLPSMPDYRDPRSGSLEERARAYLEVNCAHCHRPGGPAKNSGLNLSYTNKDLFTLGVGKPPVAAGKGSGGLSYDIVPGHADASILIFRMASLDPAVMMPELGRKTVHAEGLQLIRDWINDLE